MDSATTTRRQLRLPVGLRPAALAAALLIALIVGAAARAAGTQATVTVAAAGDIACDPTSRSFNGGAGTGSACAMAATAALVRDIAPDAVLVLGDAQYEDGTARQYRLSYALSWGAFKDITWPAPGNHEYHTRNAAAYFDYFGSRAGETGKGYYSFDLGAWHIVALNSNCSDVGGCEVGSPQERWLRADLAAHPTSCALAFWHHPLFNSGKHGSATEMRPIWQDLQSAGVELVLNGHEHIYERFAPQDAQGRLDERGGVREFIVGTGGKSHHTVTRTVANSQVHNDDTYGVLELTLKPDAYAWRFVPVAGKSFTDSGEATCH